MTAKKDRIRRLLAGTSGNIVDTNAERWYNVGDWVKIGPGVNNLSWKDGRIVLYNTSGIGFDMATSGSVFKTGPAASMDADPTQFSMDGWSFNYLSKYINVGSVAFPFRLFHRTPPRNILKAGALAMSIMEMLKG